MSEKTLTDAIQSHKVYKKILVLMGILFILSQLFFIMPFSWSTSPVKTIRIGVIAPFDEYASYDEVLFKQILEPEINEYIAKLPRNRFRPVTNVEFVIESASWDPEKNLEIVKKFHNDGINLLIGGHYTYLAASALDYVNAHGMIMISPSSTGTELSIEGDNLFRLVPDDVGQVNAIAEMLHSKGIENLVIIQRDDSRTNDIAAELLIKYSGMLIGVSKYAVGTIDFTECLTAAETMITGQTNAGVLLLSLDEAGLLLDSSTAYPVLSSLEWFGSDGTAEQPDVLTYAGAQACNVKLYSPMTAYSPETATSSKHLYMKTLFEGVTGYPFGFYTACEIDAGWLLVLGVLETQRSLEPFVVGQDIADVFPDIASRYYGYSGWCELNAAGDRVPGNYDIHGYGYVDGDPDFVIFGRYNTASNTITWFP
ncbi:ABC transporter substrate-binding protein [Candidatus Bathyarchaeota archaeon]|nr:ABC transporter substrate-binding protein [Candidatus Bathyarchaeota archaeon]